MVIPPGIDRSRAGGASTPSDDQGPQLLLSWRSPASEFAGNLRLLLGTRIVLRISRGSQPAQDFWSGVDLRTPLPRRGLGFSLLFHAALLGALYSASGMPRGTAHLVESAALRSFGGAEISAYLPELHGEPARRKDAGHYDPAPGLQKINSLPDEPDNLRQTIVAPPPVRLKQDLALPNLAAMNPVPAVQPLSASSRAALPRLPQMLPQVVQPAVDAASAAARNRLAQMLPDVVRPVVDARDVHARNRLKNFAPEIVQPAVDASRSKARLTLPSFAPDVVRPAPDLHSVSRSSSGNLAQMLNRGADPTPPAPQVNSAPHGAGAVLALNLNPADIHQPVAVPEGNRRGEFATSPNGRAGAAGTPGADSSAGAGATPGQRLLNAPEGIDVFAPRPQVDTANLPNAPRNPAASAQPPPSADPETKSKLLAAMRGPALHNLQPHPPAQNTPLSQLETRVFNGRRSYTLAVNMPNLNAATGSWIIHFVERDPNAKSTPIAAPEVVHKSDPAYPGDLIHDGVEGTVILTAVIRADGTVGNITVAKSVDPRLDRNAVEALSRWVFRPAIKDGRNIDLDAVVLVPYRAHGPKL
ncbi:MAG: TonB family protein [Acidobacteriota bacterium]|nr:TonB family protein [Acidobacteriota bacterium]